MAVAWIAGLGVRRFGPRWGLVDKPGHRKVHSTVMPTGGGLAIWLGIVVPLALGQLFVWGLYAGGFSVKHAGLPDGSLARLVALHLGGLVQQSGKLWTMLAGGTVLTILGLLDDRFGLSWKLRLSVEAAVALTLVLLGWRMHVFLDAPWLTGALSVVWIVGLINSFNMLDNMDGLSAGVAAIAATMLAVVTLAVPIPTTDWPQLFIGGFLLVMVGSLLGFLVHNRPPARLFMGDAGSYLIGYLLAMMTLTATFAPANVPRHAILAPLCVLAVPLYDTLTVLVIRLRSGRSPFVGDRNHFSHRLVELGMTKGQAVLTIYLATATCGLGALLLHEVQSSLGAVVILALVACTLLLVAILETAGRRHRSEKN
jgi:UDP-GlcNAc:undecaprenyl-phosphate GlcNAc-1-phosphate transferase